MLLQLTLAYRFLWVLLVFCTQKFSTDSRGLLSRAGRGRVMSCYLCGAWFSGAELARRLGAGGLPASGLVVAGAGGL